MFTLAAWLSRCFPNWLFSQMLLKPSQPGEAVHLLPSDLAILMGAQTGDHHYSFFVAVVISMTTTLGGDILGKYRGRSVLSLLCKLSMEPDTCVRKTESSFSARIQRSPGRQVRPRHDAGLGDIGWYQRYAVGRFLLADAAGCTLWVGSYLGLGWLFHKQVDKIIAALGLYGRGAAADHFGAALPLLCL